MRFLNFLCSELKCYLDELKSDRRGDVSKKRKLIIIALSMYGLDKSEICKLLNKDYSSVYQALKKIKPEDTEEVALLTQKFNDWEKNVYNKLFS